MNNIAPTRIGVYVDPDKANPNGRYTWHLQQFNGEKWETIIVGGSDNVDNVWKDDMAAYKKRISRSR